MPWLAPSGYACLHIFSMTRTFCLAPTSSTRPEFGRIVSCCADLFGVSTLGGETGNWRFDRRRATTQRRYSVTTSIPRVWWQPIKIRNLQDFILLLDVRRKLVLLLVILKRELELNHFMIQSRNGKYRLLMISHSWLLLVLKQLVSSAFLITD